MFSIIAKKIGNKLDYCRKDLEDIISQLPEGKDIIISFDVVQEQKTREQLGYFFAGIIREASKYFGWDEEDMYNFLMSQVNKKPIVNPITGEIEYIAVGLSRINKAEMVRVIEDSIRLLSEYGYITPEPYYNLLTNLKKDDRNEKNNQNKNKK